MAARKYEQRLRAESAEGTRRRILDALADQLRKAPSQPASVDQIARTAGVARATVYLIFGSRAGLFLALAGDLLERSGFGHMLGEAGHPDAKEGLRRGIRATAEMFAVERDVLRVLYSMAQLDADAVGGAVQRMEDGRAAGARYRAKVLADQHQLRADMTVDDAAHLLWLLTSFEAFDLLATGRGLSAEKTADLLARIAEKSLCVPLQDEGA